MKRLVVILAIALAVVWGSTASAAHASGFRADTLDTQRHHVLHVGNTGKRVAALEWLLAGHRPSATRIVAYRGPIDGRYTLRVKASVKNMKYRLGWPRSQVTGTAGQRLFDIVKGQRARPRAYIERATKRLALLKRIRAQRAKSSCARNVLRIARGELGVHEIPWGSNDGARVRVYQAVTRAYRAPWCVSFVQWVFRVARVGSPRAWAGAIADNSAGAFYVASWARRAGWLQSAPKPANIVVFLDRLGHVGIVARVVAGGFYSIEGNASDSVLERFHPFGQRPEVFVRVPGCAAG